MNIRLSSILPFVELARFHTKESFLECFPAIWGVVFAHGTMGRQQPLGSLAFLLVMNWMCMTLLHGTFCIINDIVDIRVDGNVNRTKTRPLPSGRISKTEAYYFFAMMLMVTALVTYYALGPQVLFITSPIWLIATFYPYAKRLVPWPQFVLAPAVALPAFAGWASSAGYFSFKATPLFFAVCLWTIYFDTCYGVQDYHEDRKLGVNSLPVYLGNHTRLFLAVLGTAIIGLFSLHAWFAQATWMMWLGGIAVWALAMVKQLRMLRLEKPSSGGIVFRENINLGLYITIVSLVEIVYKNSGKMKITI